MNNLYYTTREVQQMFGYKTRATVAKHRTENSVNVGKRWYYLRKEIDELIENVSAEQFKIAMRAYDTFELVDIDMQEYLGLQEALKVFGRSRQRLYQVKDAGKIEVIKYDGFMWFRKSDLM